MAGTVVGRVSFAVRRPPSGLEQYGARKLAGVPAIMQQSEQRLYEDVAAHTPVKTGHMRASLLRTSDLATVDTEYAVFWRDQEFTGEVNPAGHIIDSFYPATLILGSRFWAAKYPGLLTDEAEAERPRLVRDLRAHFARP